MATIPLDNIHRAIKQVKHDISKLNLLDRCIFKCVVVNNSKFPTPLLLQVILPCTIYKRPTSKINFYVGKTFLQVSTVWSQLSFKSSLGGLPGSALAGGAGAAALAVGAYAMSKKHKKHKKHFGSKHGSSSSSSSSSDSD